MNRRLERPEMHEPPLQGARSAELHADPSLSWRAPSGLASLVLLFTLMSCALARADVPPLPEVPDAVPDLPADDLESVATQRVSHARAEIERLRAASAPDDELSLAWGRLGQLAMIYGQADAARIAFVHAARHDPSEFKWWHFLGSLDRDAGRWQEATTWFERALELEPDDVPALVKLADVLVRVRRYDEAEPLFRQALVTEPDTAIAEFGLGRIAAARKDFETAIRHFRRTLELQPGADAARHPLAQALRRAGDLDGAKAALEGAGTSMPDLADPWEGQAFEIAATSRSYLLEGNRARRRGLDRLAMDNYRKALELDARNADALYNLGVLIGEQGAPEQALEYFQRAVSADPKHALSRFNLAVGLRARGELEQAVGQFRHAVELDPGDLEPRLELAVTLHALRRTDQAKTVLSEAWATRPTDPDLLIRLARYLLMVSDEATAEDVLAAAKAAAGPAEDRAKIVLLDAERVLRGGDTQAAEALYRKAVEIAPDLAQARLELGRLLGVQRRWNEAAEQLVRATQLDPRDEQAATGASTALALDGRWREALTVLDAASRELPDSVVVVIELIRVLTTAPDPELRDGARAVSLAEPLHAAFPTPPIRELVAMAYAAAGRFDQAIDWQERFVADARGAAPPEILRRLEENLARYRRREIAVPPW